MGASVRPSGSAARACSRHQGRWRPTVPGEPCKVKSVEATLDAINQPAHTSSVASLAASCNSASA